MARRVIVGGPPCAGKSSYVHDRSQRGDLIYDYDTLHMALSGQGSHDHLDEIRPYVLAARNRVLDLVALDDEQPVWVISSSPKMAELSRLQTLINAELVVLNVSREEAHQRCEASGRPAEWHGYIDNWFEQSDIQTDGVKRGGQMNMKSYRLASFKALDQAQGVFEALVAVFGNVDRAGDMIMPGAFTESLAGWKAKGRPIPVIFSHDWGNLDAHIGLVLEAKEIQEGLYVKGQLEMDEPFAARVWKKMNQGTLAEFSFAYNVLDAAFVKQNGQMVQELRRLDLLEVGPCLVGMNPETELLGVRALAPDGKAGRRNSGKDQERIQRLHDLACELGAKCAQADASDTTGDDGVGDGESKGKAEAQQGKAEGLRPGTLAARVALELLELG